MSTTEGPFAAEVVADSSGEFVGNALRFPTVEAAEAYAVDLHCRWTLVRTWRIVKYTPSKRTGAPIRRVVRVMV